MEQKVYRSGISWSLFIPLLVIFSVISTVMFLNSFPAGILFMVFPVIFMLHTLLNTFYIVEGSTLIIKSGILYHKKIEISSIKSIVNTSSILSSPAASMKNRIEIRYKKWDVVIISPKEKQEFMDHLLGINPEIALKLTFKKLK